MDRELQVKLVRALETIASNMSFVSDMNKVHSSIKNSSLILDEFLNEEIMSIKLSVKKLRDAIDGRSPQV